MTNAIFLVLTCGAVNWGYAYPMAFLLIVFLRQKKLRKEIYLNFFYSAGFWLLLFSCLLFVAIGKRNITALFHYGILPTVAYMIGWCASEGSADEEIRDYILALVTGFGVYAALNGFVNGGNNRYMLIDFWTGSYRAATGSGTLNTMIVSIALYVVAFEKRRPVKFLLSCLFLFSIRYMFILGTRTQFTILLIVGIVGSVFFSYKKSGIRGTLKAFGVMVLVVLCLLLIYQTNFLSARDAIEHTNLANRFSNRSSVKNSDDFRIQSLWVGLKELVLYPLGGRASEKYRHNMWLDVARVSGIIPFATLLMYSVNIIKKVWTIYKKKLCVPELCYLLLLLYAGVYINFCVEPIWEGQLNFFLSVCVIDGMVNEMARRTPNESHAREIIPITQGIHTNM